MSTATTDNPTDTPVLTIANGVKVKPGDTVYDSKSKLGKGKKLSFGKFWAFTTPRWKVQGGGEAEPTSLYATQPEAQAARLADLIELERKTLASLKATQAEIRKLEAVTR